MRSIAYQASKNHPKHHHNYSKHTKTHISNTVTNITGVDNLTIDNDNDLKDLKRVFTALIDALKVKQLLQRKGHTYIIDWTAQAARGFKIEIEEKRLNICLTLFVWGESLGKIVENIKETRVNNVQLL